MQAVHRVAANTGILYARMAITVFISLYATRLVLSALGAEDFGLYSVVGGVVAMLGFLNASMSSATQRFMSFAQGAGDIDEVTRIFNMSTILHLGIAIVMLLVLEIAGHFFFNGILNIAENRVDVAKLVYQFMVVSTFFTIISVPYEAVIISHENMLFYAILGVVEAVLKLAIAFYITYSELDHLAAYGFLMAALAFLLLIVRRVYCHRKYEECKINIHKYYDKCLLNKMTSFAGWNFLGSASSILAFYGQGIVINIFFGTIVNAAQSVAGQINGQLGVFSATLMKALNPMIVKSEGSGNRHLMLMAAMMGCKVSFFLLMALSIPFIIEATFILNIWLINVPDFAVIFCQLLLIRTLIEQLSLPLGTAIAAEGNIKGFQITFSILAIIPLPVSYFLFKYGYPVYLLYVVFIVYSILTLMATLFYAKNNCQLSLPHFFKNVVVRCLFSFITVFIISLIPYLYMESGITRFLNTLLLSLISYGFIVYFAGFSSEERVKIKQLGLIILEKSRISKYVLR